ncbi:MAG: hypothetical protein WCK98_07420 [bacterium]
MVYTHKFGKIEALIRSRYEVFNLKDLSVYWGENESKTREAARYYCNTGKLFRLKNGLYSLYRVPSDFEIAQKLSRPSYITYHTALFAHSINFQLYAQIIHSAANRKKSYIVGDTNFIYHQFKESILFNPIGIDSIGKTYAMASAERAICDSLYLNPDIAFDRLDKIDTDKLVEISQIYGQKSLYKNLKLYFPKIF